MGAPTKFLFDVDFARGAERKQTLALADHMLKIAEAEKAAHDRGYAAAQADAKVESDRRITTALERVAAAIAASNSALKAIETRLECEAVEVAVAVGRKLAPALLAHEPFAEIAALASECFRQLVATPHIAVRVNDALYSTTQEKLGDIVRTRGFEGRLVVLAESDIAPGDCRIEWADGGVNRDSAAADAEISKAVTGYLTARRSFAGAKNNEEVHK
ncbi:MAG: FliH/SctL family protein [Xanthobacteraceae bacterium]